MLRRLSLALLLLASCATQPDVLVSRTYIHADYDAVWDAFATRDGYAPWYSTPCRTFGDTPGDRCVWASGKEVMYAGELLSIEHGRGLAHTFSFVVFDFDEPPTTVHIGIEPRGETVLVTVEHDCTGAPRTRDVITDVGWQKSLSRLKTLLETGAAMPWPTDA